MTSCVLCYYSDAATLARLARYLRSLLMFTLHSARTTSHQDAYQYLQIAVAVIQEANQATADQAGDSEDQGYPLDEQTWLLSTAWQAGVELYK